MFNEQEYRLKLGDNIRIRRDEVSYSQQVLADTADIAKSTVQRIEKGELNPTVTVLAKIALAMNMNLSELLPDNL